MIHDRDSIYSEGVDAAVAAMGLTILKTPVRAPQANAFCERLIGTMRRECLDWLIPPSAAALQGGKRSKVPFLAMWFVSPHESAPEPGPTTAYAGFLSRACTMCHSELSGGVFRGLPLDASAPEPHAR